MIIIKSGADLQKVLAIYRAENKTIGFVPTMGALHDGHMSLIVHSQQITAVTVCSIFVNPTQFNDLSDFEKYPKTLAADISLLESHHCDILFLPSVEEMYPNGLVQKKKYEIGAIENLLEGAHRPGHFQGVCQVVDLLLGKVQPDKLVMGQKDYQQVKVLTKMLEITQSSVEMVMVPTLRTSTGLAFSSRNMRLSEKAIEEATILNQALQFAKESIDNLSIAAIEEEAKKRILAAGFDTVDYFSICQSDDLQQAQDNTGKLTALVAAWIEGVRLIDNKEL